MNKIYNFTAGPAMLPVEVMQQAHDEFLNWQNRGYSVMEISHRSAEFLAVAEQSEQDLRDLLSIPKDYHVLFLPAGARGQFSCVPLNLLDQFEQMAYVHSGLWSGYAIEEAKKYGAVNVVADAATCSFKSIPPQSEWADCKDAAYLYYTDNETVHGLEFSYVPKQEGVSLVVDMTSNLLSRPINVADFGVIFASSQKNLGMAGITVVIIADHLLKRTPAKSTPSVLNYALQAEKQSMYNTPPTYPWYMLGLVLKWAKQQGGVQALSERNQRKADKLYRYIDSSSFYNNAIDPRYRSRMNVVMTLPDTKLETLMGQEARQAGLIGLEGHRAAGGIRASIYNAMPEAGIDALLEFMQEFERRNG